MDSEQIQGWSDLIQVGSRASNQVQGHAQRNCYRQQMIVVWGLFKAKVLSWGDRLIFEKYGARLIDDTEMAELTQQTNFICSCNKDFRVSNQETTCCLSSLV